MPPKAQKPEETKSTTDLSHGTKGEFSTPVKTETPKGGDSTSDGPLFSDAATSSTASAADPLATSEPEDVFVVVGRPCVKCWPKGWPAKEDGASVNCPHNLLVIYGRPNRVPRSLALECGLAEGTDFHPIPAKVSE